MEQQNSQLFLVMVPMQIAADKRIDDETLCDKVKRGEFRLHPKGATGRSEGCIVIDKDADFFRLRAMLKSAKPISIPGIQLHAYGRLVVQWK